MKIRTKLTLQFSIIVVMTFLIASLIIYAFSSNYRKNQFSKRLEDKALTIAKLLIEVEEVDSILLNIIESADQTILYNEKVIIVNPENKIIFDSRKEIKIDYNEDLFESVRIKNKLNGIIKDFEFAGLLYYDNNIEYVVISSAKDLYGFSKLNNLRKILFVCFFTLILITLILGWIFSGRALKPISEMIKEVKCLTSNNLKSRLETGTNKDELAELAKTFNTMINELETAFDIQKEFVSNASHELRTPLTIIKSQIDVALLSRRDSQEYEDVLKSISEDISSLSNLINNLLLLAQTSSTISNHTFINVRIDEILWNVRQIVLKKNSTYKIVIEFLNLPNEEIDFNIKANHILLRNAFVNIVENACRYSENKTVSISLRKIENEIEIRFSDEGLGISKEDLDNIFIPFFRCQNAKHIEGHGIGLSLVKNIIDIHKGKISITSIEKKGTTVKILLPVI